MNTRERLAAETDLRDLARELQRLMRACEDSATVCDVGSSMHGHALGLAMGYRRAAMWILDALGDDIGVFAPSPLRDPRARAAALGEEAGR